MEVDAVHLRDVFPANIDDVEFLPALKGNYDVYITYDHRQRTRLAEARAIKEAGVTALWLGPFWGKKIDWEQAKWLISRWPSIHAFASSVVPGTCAEIKENGKVRVFHL